jgi:pimeloyl-ACP methyl ester carboxylesterase
MREDLRQFTDTLDLARFVLGGHCMGGTVTELFAERYPGPAGRGARGGQPASRRRRRLGSRIPA